MDDKEANEMKYVSILSNKSGCLLERHLPIPDGEDIKCEQRDEGIPFCRPTLTIIGLKRQPGYIYGHWECVHFWAVSSSDQELTEVIKPFFTILKSWYTQQLMIEEMPDCENCDLRMGDPPDYSWRD